MLKNYLKIAFRNILRNKLYSFLNISGLAIGMAACILILLWVTNELGYNGSDKNLDRIFLVAQTQHYQNKGNFTVEPTPLPLARTLRTDYPEVEYASRYEHFMGKRVLALGEKAFEERVNLADSSFFKIFTFHFLEGDPNTALASPNSIVLTEETARKFFGDTDPMGRHLKLDGKVDFRVTGVITDLPRNSDIRFDALVPVDVLKTIGFGWAFGSWGTNMISTFVLLKKPGEAPALTRDISDLIRKRGDDPTGGTLFLFPFKNYHLYSLNGQGGEIEDVILFSIVALFILMIACVNFMNLATARSARRATEVGVKKVVGASRLQIARQFFGESIILTLISLGFGLVLVELLLPYFNEITGKTLALSQMGPGSVIMILAVTVFTGFLAGIYPSVVLSSLKPATMLKKEGSNVPGRFSLRRILVVFQFAISIVLLIGTAIVFLQMRYIHNKNLGLSVNNVVYFRPTGPIAAEIARLGKELKQDPNILAVTTAVSLPISIRTSSSGWEWEGMPPKENALVSYTWGGYGYLKTFDMSLKEGRFFSREHPPDDTASVVINESFARLIGKKSPVGMQLRWNHPYTVIGVVHDFNFLSLRNKVGPLAILYGTRATFICARVRGAGLPATLAYIDRTCKGIDPGFVFDPYFLNKTFERMYVSGQRLENIIGAFSLLAVIIACLGLFGLSSLAAETRTKEVGIRKVLGASVPGVTYLLSKELIVLVLLGNVIAWPVAYYFMQKWLDTFAYRINMNILVYVFAAVVALVIAAATTGYQALKAATSNPIGSLRYE